MNADNFVELLDNPRVEEKLSSIFKSLFVTITKEITKPLEIKIDELSSLVKKLQADVAARDTKIDGLVADIKKLRGELHDANMEIQSLEQYSRRDNLVISGIPSSAAETASATDDSSADSRNTTIQKVVELCNNTLDLNISVNDISAAHRLRSGRSANQGAKPLVLVRFARRAVRDEVFYARSKLKSFNTNKDMADRIYVNEDLTTHNRLLLGAAKRELKSKSIRGAWTSNCHVKIRCLDDSVHTVSSAADLHARIAAHNLPHFDI